MSSPFFPTRSNTPNIAHAIAFINAFCYCIAKFSLHYVLTRKLGSLIIKSAGKPDNITNAIENGNQKGDES